MSMSNWINVMDYGAVGDGETDDTKAIFKAITTAAQRGLRGGAVVYFPPLHRFLIAGAQTLPPVTVWVTLYLDAPLFLGGTLTVPGGYVIYGHTGGEFTAFSMDTLGLITHRNDVNPLIYIHSTGVRLENIQFIPSDGADGIVIEQSARIALKNLWGQTSGGGVPVRISGGFGYEVEGGGFASTGDAPSFLLTDDSHCGGVGILRMRNFFLANHGISVKSACGGINSLTFENALYEEGKDAFLTLDNESYGMWAISIKDINAADHAVNPAPPIISAHSSRKDGIHGVTMVNAQTDGGLLTTGDPIADLEVWTPSTYQVGQTNGYVLHRPDGIFNTMPTYPSAVGGIDFNISSDGPTSQGNGAGGTALFPLTVSATSGFNQRIELSCSGAPPASTCTVSPSSVSLAGPAISSVMVAITTTTRTYGIVARLISVRGVSLKYWILGVSTVLGFCALLLWRASRRQRGLAWATAPAATLLLTCIGLFISSCAGVVAGTTSKPGAGPKPASTISGTPSGFYTISVSGTSAGSPKLTHSVQLVLDIP